jgi:hypothetical protein
MSPATAPLLATPIGDGQQLRQPPAERRVVPVYGDQFGAPTSARDDLDVTPSDAERRGERLDHRPVGGAGNGARGDGHDQRVPLAAALHARAPSVRAEPTAHSRAAGAGPDPDRESHHRRIVGPRCPAWLRWGRTDEDE